MLRRIRWSGGNVHYHPTTPRYIGVREDIAHGGSGREGRNGGGEEGEERGGRERGREGGREEGREGGRE